MTAYEEIATVSDPAQAGRRTSLAPAPKKGTSKLKQKEHITALSFISVKYVGLFIFTLLPLLLALLYGFTDYTGADTGKPFFSQLDKYGSDSVITRLCLQALLTANRSLTR